jgi:integrase
LKREHADGIDVGRTAPTVAVLAREWLVKAAPNKKAASTLSRVRARVEGHVVPGVGHHRIDQLRPEHVEAWLAGESTTALRTLQDYRGDLREILAWAQRRRLVSWNAAAEAELPSDARPPAERRTLSPEQAAALLTGLEGDRLGPFFTVLLLLGLRPGEADALTWEHVDFDAGTVRIERALQRASGGTPLGIGPTKTKQNRTLAMPAAVRAAFRTQRASQRRERLASGPGWSREWEGLVFLSEIGTPLHPSNTRRSFAAACARAGIPTFTPYELRHSAASLLVAAGVDPYEVADQLGHVDLRMLDRHYRHRIEPVVTAGVATMDRLAGGIGFPSKR